MEICPLRVFLLDMTHLMMQNNMEILETPRKNMKINVIGSDNLKKIKVMKGQDANMKHK